MQINRIQSDLKFVNQIGQTLNIDERMRLELALLNLGGNYHFDDLFFWGRIEGIERDYYIALGLKCKGQYEFPLKKFFWASSTNTHFSELPSYNPKYISQAELLREPFTGQHEKIVFKQTDVEFDEYNLDDSLEIPAQLPEKSFSELERLSFVVNTIEHLCALVPIGAYKLTPTHELLINENFKGLSQNDLTNSNKYQHFRQPLSEEKKEFIARDDALFKPDFLDQINIDYPYQSWTIQTDSTKSNVTLRSLLWPGFLAYHRANTNIFGYSYFGDGIKNSDFEFLI